MNNNEFIENEDAQRKMEKYNIDKGSVWQGDLVSGLIFNLSKEYISGKILDVGAGTGALVDVINEKGYSAIGLDLYPKKLHTRKGVITNIPFDDFRFNTIFCTEVLEHLTTNQIDAGIEEIRRVLSFDGFFIITVPFNENIKTNSYKCPECNNVFHPFEHIQSFNLENLKTLLEKRGFKIICNKILPLHLMTRLPHSKLYYKPLMKMINKLDYTKTLFIVAKKDVETSGEKQ